MLQARMTKVLLVEDNLLNRDVLSRRLRDHGYQVQAAVTAEEAWRLVVGHRPDVILLDLELPDANGTSVASQLKQDTETWTIPIIALSGYVDDTTRDQALNAGCDAYLSKPIDFDELIAAIGRLTA